MDGSDQHKNHNDSYNNNAGFVRHVESPQAKRTGVLELEPTTDNLALWGRVLGVITVNFETYPIAG